MNRKVWVGISLVVIVILGFIVSSYLFRQEQGQEPLRIGAALSLTGAIAPYGRSAQRGIELAVSEINDHGGINGQRLKIILEDCQSEPRPATLAVQKLISQDKVPAVVGFIGSSLLLATAPLFNENHVVLISPGASSPGIREAGDFVFRTRASGRLEAITLARYANKNLNCRKTGVLYVNNTYGLSWLESFSECTTSLGGEIVAKEGFQQGSTDLRAQLSKIKTSDPSCLLILGYLDEIALALRQSTQLGLVVPILTTVGIQDNKIFELAGKTAQRVVFSAVDYDPSTNPVSKRFDKAYSATFGQPSNIFAANAYDAVQLLANAIKKVGINGDRIRQYLLSIENYPGAGGTLSFDQKGDVIKPVHMKKVEGNKFIAIDY